MYQGKIPHKVTKKTKMSSIIFLKTMETCCNDILLKIKILPTTSK